jgi:metal-sulfur cluster biosynthetic enzyme
VTTLAAIQAALDRVRDPEVDRPITTMGFVAEVGLDDDGVRITLRLPTYFCAPNFSHLMMADAKRAVEEVVGAGRVRVHLADHSESGRLNAGLAAGQRFSMTFGREATGDLEGLRDRFRRKTFLVRQERVCRRLDQERPAIDLLALALADLPAWPECEEYLEMRAKLGISCDPPAPFLVAADGTPVRRERLRTHRRAASVIGLSFAANGSLCQSLLAVRYDTRGATP